MFVNSVSTKLNVILNNFNSSFKTKFIALQGSTKYYSTNQNESTNEAGTKSSNIIINEDLPPIPPNYGWIGDENIKSMFEMKEIEKSFQQGNAPRMKRRLNRGPLVMRLLPIQTCNNRHFYRIAVTRHLNEKTDPFLEDLGSIDPMPNKENQILIALNIERIKYYISKSVPIKGSVGPILGLAGLIPVHPRSYLVAFRNRRKLKELNENKNQKIEEN